MKITPLAHYPAPRFPTRAIIDAHPELLRLVPARWQRSAVVLTALATVCLLTSGCRKGAASAAASRDVAPLFASGDGIYYYSTPSFSGLSAGPSGPDFVTESDARQIIIYEARLAGIKFLPDAVTLPDVELPVTNAATRQHQKTRKASLTLDGTDAKLGISYEYVSSEDFDAWHGDARFSFLNNSSVETFDFKDTATKLREGLAKAAPGQKCAVFYDPGSGCTSSELRKQVQSFIEWLKAEGVI